MELSGLLKALAEHNKTGNGYQIQLNSGNLDDKSARNTGIGIGDLYFSECSTLKDSMILSFGNMSKKPTGQAEDGTNLYPVEINSNICNGVQREHNKKLNNGLPILHKVPPKRDYGQYFCIMAEKGGTSHGGLTEKLSPFFHAKKQEVNAYGR